MALIAAHLSEGVILVGAELNSVGSPSLSTSWDLGPHQHLFGDNLTLSKFSQPSSQPLRWLCHPFPHCQQQVHHIDTKCHRKEDMS